MPRTPVSQHPILAKSIDNTDQIPCDECRPDELGRIVAISVALADGTINLASCPQPSQSRVRVVTGSHITQHLPVVEGIMRADELNGLAGAAAQESDLLGRVGQACRVVYSPRVKGEEVVFAAAETRLLRLTVSVLLPSRYLPPTNFSLTDNLQLKHRAISDSDILRRQSRAAKVELDASL